MGYKICNFCNSTNIIDEVVDFCGDCRSYDIGYILPNGKKEVVIIDKKAIQEKYQNKEAINKQAIDEIDKELFVTATKFTSIAINVLEEFHRGYRIFDRYTQKIGESEVISKFAKKKGIPYVKKVMYAFDSETTSEPIKDLLNGKIKNLDNFIVRYKLLIEDNEIKQQIIEYAGFCKSSVVEQEARKHYNYLLSKRNLKINARIKELTENI